MQQALIDLRSQTDDLRVSHKNKDKELEEIFLSIRQLQHDLDTHQKLKHYQSKLDISIYLKQDQFSIIFSYLTLNDLFKMRLLSRNLNFYVKQQFKVLQEKNSKALSISDELILQFEQENWDYTEDQNQKMAAAEQLVEITRGRIRKDFITELKSLVSPPCNVLQVLDCLRILVNCIERKQLYDGTWPSCKKMLSSHHNFEILLQFDKDLVSEKQLLSLNNLIGHLTEQHLANVCYGAGVIYRFVSSVQQLITLYHSTAHFQQKNKHKILEQKSMILKKEMKAFKIVLKD